MKKVNYSKDLLEEKIVGCYSLAELCRRLGIKPYGSNPSFVRRKLDEYNIDYSSFTGQRWNTIAENPIYVNKYAAGFCKNSSYSSSHAKELLFKLGLKENKCECCGVTEWLGNKLNCELHHINGDRTDNRIENLKILCPNCHSQTDNYCKKIQSA